MVLGEGAVSYERGTPVSVLTTSDPAQLIPGPDRNPGMNQRNLFVPRTLRKEGPMDLRIANKLLTGDMDRCVLLVPGSERFESPLEAAPV